jgi:hypothetical protein
MVMFTSKASLALCSLALGASAASFPPKPENVTIVQSNKFPGVSISYKEVNISIVCRVAYAKLDVDKHLRNH